MDEGQKQRAWEQISPQWQNPNALLRDAIGAQFECTFSGLHDVYERQDSAVFSNASKCTMRGPCWTVTHNRVSDDVQLRFAADARSSPLLALTIEHAADSNGRTVTYAINIFEPDRDFVSAMARANDAANGALEQALRRTASNEGIRDYPVHALLNALGTSQRRRGLFQREAWFRDPAFEVAIGVTTLHRRTFGESREQARWLWRAHGSEKLRLWLEQHHMLQPSDAADVLARDLLRNEATAVADALDQQASCAVELSPDCFRALVFSNVNAYWGQWGLASLTEAWHTYVRALASLPQQFPIHPKIREMGGGY